MSDQPNRQELEGRAYREAGHVVIAYLVVKAGAAEHLFALPIEPGDRSWLVPDFDTVDLQSELSSTERPSPSLRSLLTTPLFLMGGIAAERIRQGVPAEAPHKESRALGRARGMLASYAEEFQASDPVASMNTMFTDLYQLTERELRSNWNSVQAVAEALLDQLRLSKATAFELVEANLPESTKEAVRAVGDRRAPDRPT